MLLSREEETFVSSREQLDGAYVASMLFNYHTKEDVGLPSHRVFRCH